MKIAKKLLVCGLSLALVSSTGLTSVSAQHIHSHHVRVSRINRKSSKYLSFHQLIHLMNYDYKLSKCNDEHSLNKYLHFNKKCDKLISNTLERKLNNYTVSQLKQIQNNKDAVNVGVVNHDEDVYSVITNFLFDRTHDVNKITQQDNSFDTEVRSYLINNINNTRVSYGLNPLTINYVAQSVANYRAPRVQYAYDHLSDYSNYPHNTSNPTDNWVHGIDVHETSSEYLKHHHYPFGSVSENVGNWGSKFTENGDSSPVKYPNDTPEHVADNIDDGIINHDNCEGNANGHRDNELDPQWRHIGVGIHYNLNTNSGAFDEEFSN